MKKYISTLLVAGMAFGMTQIHAETVKPASRKATHAKATPAVSTDPDEAEPDTGKSSAVEYHCAMGSKVTIYTNADDDSHIAVRWQKRVHRMLRVPTDTGANRFENKRYNLVWIGIPAKGILLDSKKVQQLANDCKNAEQMEQKN